MKLRKILTVMLLPAAFLLAGTASAITVPGSGQVSLNVDTAPNVYGSPDWPGWWSATKADVAAGSFTDMRSGAFPGTHKMTPYEEIVYSTGDLGQRLHWIYWVPEAQIADLEGRFQTKFVFDWAGADYTYDWSAGTWAFDDPTVGWIEPASWENYGSGVVGSFGHAWWATDNEAAPLSTGGSNYDETDQADIDALAAEVLNNQTFARGMVRTRSEAGADWTAGPSIEVAVVPAPGVLALLGSGLLGLVLVRRRAT